mgnify:CR=1 FL=1
MEADLYGVLGVLPDAEDVVIKAAYRALSQRYHPDRWTGPVAEAHERMSAINRAYEVLGDVTRRRAYDAERKASGSAPGASFDHSSDVLTDDHRERWKVACSIYPDLATTRQQLGQLSTALAFSFVVTVVEHRLFGARNELAAKLEREFLEKYFGTHPEVLEYAKFLLRSGNKEAAKGLNKLVDVMGSDLPPALLISRIDRDYKVTATAQEHEAAKRQAAWGPNLARQVMESSFVSYATELAEGVGYTLQESGGGFFKAYKLHVTNKQGFFREFTSLPDFVVWVREEICPQFLSS